MKVRQTASLGIVLLATSCTLLTALDAPLPLFPQFDQTDADDEAIRLTAGLSGHLVVKGGCLLIDRGQSSFTPIFPQRAQIGRDRRGVFVRDTASGETIRPGDRVYGGGAVWKPGAPGVESLARLNARITPDLPPECAKRVGGFHDFKRGRPPWADEATD